ncbi:hypothetical protein ACR42D_08865 [Desulfovibrio caledoniensis]
MSETTQTLKRLQRQFTEINENLRPPQFVWQVVHKESDFFQSIDDFDPVDIHRNSLKAHLPDDEATLITQINTGRVLLLGGILRLILVPDEMDLGKVEALMNALLRKHPENRSAMYEEAVKLIFKES